MSKYFLHFLCFNLKHGLSCLRFPLEKTKTKQKQNKTDQISKRTNKAKQKHKMKKRKLLKQNIIKFVYLVNFVRGVYYTVLDSFMNV